MNNRKVEYIEPSQKDLLALSCMSVFTAYTQSRAKQSSQMIRPGYIVRKLGEERTVYYVSDVINCWCLLYPVVFDANFGAFRKSGQGEVVHTSTVELADLPDVTTSDKLLLQDRLSKGLSDLMAARSDRVIDSAPEATKEKVVQLTSYQKVLARMLGATTNDE